MVLKESLENCLAAYLFKAKLFEIWIGTDGLSQLPEDGDVSGDILLMDDNKDEWTANHPT
jgi:hypothetical protein